MSSRRKIPAAILALLVLPGLVAGAAFANCSHQDPAPHACCAMEGPQDTTSHGCCGDEAPRMDQQAGGDCSCSHAPEVPASPAATASQALQKDGPVQDVLPAAATPVLPEADWTFTSTRHRGPPPGHAPLFLLDCSLLL